MSNQAKNKKDFQFWKSFCLFWTSEKEKEKENRERDILYQERNDGDNTQNPEDQMNDEGLYFSASVFREEINYTKDLLS